MCGDFVVGVRKGSLTPLLKRNKDKTKVKSGVLKYKNGRISCLCNVARPFR